MAKRSRAEGENKSEFIRTKLGENPEIKVGEVNEAWTAAGHKGSIAPTLFYLVKSKMGLSRRRRRRGRRAAAASAAAPANNTASAYSEIERALDRLILLASDLKDGRLSDDLRAARRRASARLI